MSNQKKVVHIVPSTHWDREWYLPFRRYQPRLVRLLQKVMKLTDSPAYKDFLLEARALCWRIIWRFCRRTENV